MASAKATTDHDEIRRWVEARGGFPAHVKRTGADGDPGVLRIDYPGFSGQKTLQRIDWDTWFEWFDRDNLAFLYQNTARSRFSKLVKRSAGVSPAGSRASSPAKKKTTKKTAAASTKKKTTTAAAKSNPKTTTKTKSKTTTATAAGRRSASRRDGGATKSTAAKRTTNHNVIRRWVESRGGFPARVKSSGRGKDPGVLRIDYPGFSGTKTLQRMEWDEWFDWFDRDKLAFLYQDKPRSKFSKLVTR